MSKKRGDKECGLLIAKTKRDIAMNKGLICIRRTSSLIKGTAVDGVKGDISKYARKPRSKEANCFCHCEPGFHMINSHMWATHASD